MAAVASRHPLPWLAMCCVVASCAPVWVHSSVCSEAGSGSAFAPSTPFRPCDIGARRSAACASSARRTHTAPRIFRARTCSSLQLRASSSSGLPPDPSLGDESREAGDDDASAADAADADYAAKFGKTLGGLPEDSQFRAADGEFSFECVSCASLNPRLAMRALVSSERDDARKDRG